MSLHCCAIGLDLSPTFAGVAVHWQRRSDSDISLTRSFQVGTVTVTTTFKHNHDKVSYYFKLSAIPLREHVKLLSRRTSWVAGIITLSATGLG